MAQTRGFCFTINNFTDEHIESLESRGDFQYLVMGIERGASGTPHIQGYIHFKKPKRLATVRKIIKGGHVETRRGTPQQAADYCKKDGRVMEFGVLPVSKEEARSVQWKSVLQHAEDGDFEWIKEHYPGQWIRFSDKLQGLQKPKSQILSNLHHEWWVGPTGTGKSSTAWELYPEHFQKELNKWWDRYANEPVVILEEWSPKNECTASQLKIWGDRYPFTGQIKGGTLKKIRPLKVIVLSNYTIDECFLDPRDREPIKRRFFEINFKTSYGKVQAIDRAKLFEAEYNLCETRNVLESTASVEENTTTSFVSAESPSLESASRFFTEDYTNLADQEYFNRLLSFDNTDV